MRKNRKTTGQDAEKKIRNRRNEGVHGCERLCFKNQSPAPDLQILGVQLRTAVRLHRVLCRTPLIAWFSKCKR